MAAGKSAYDVARRQREKAARLERSAELWERGAHGEVEVARALDSLPEGWVVLHDLAWPGRPRANLDHVVIGPGGVFVVDAKNWSGRVEVRDQVLMQNGRRREPAVASTAEAAIAVQTLVPVPTLCMGVLCFVRDEPLTGWARDVMICSTPNLVDMLTSRPHVLGLGEVKPCVDSVRRSVPRRAGAPTRRPSAPPRRSRAAAGPRRTRRAGAVATVMGGALFFGVLLGGGLQKVGDWVGEQMVEQMAPADPSPAEQPEIREKKQQKRQQRQGR